MPAANGVTLATEHEMQRVLAESRQTPFGVKVPKWAVPFNILGFGTPADYNVQVQLVQYQAKANWYAVVCGIVLQFQGTGPAPNPGDVQFTVDIDRPLGSIAGYAEKDYGAVPIVLGSFTQSCPWPVEFRHSDGEIIRVKGTAIQNMGTGAGNSLLACLVGFEWPQQGYEGF
jgi:hypothetical protein